MNRQFLRRPLAWAALAGLVVVACSSPDPAPEKPYAPAPRPDPAEGLGAALAPVICEQMALCQGPGFSAKFSEIEGCHLQIKGEIDALWRLRIQATFMRGKLRYDAAKLGDCVERTRALGCGYQTMRLKETCDGLLVGLVPEPSCLDSLECTSAGHYCDSCFGTCVPRLGEGEACKHDDDCQQGLLCVYKGETRVCGKPAAAGEPCSIGLPCEPGSSCDGVEALLSQPSVCRANQEIYRAGPGEHCALRPVGGWLCAPGLGCTNDEVCIQTPGLGEPCQKAWPHACAPGTYCSPYGTCRAPLEDGEFSPSEDQDACKPGRIRDVVGRCALPGAEGALCESPGQCYGRCDHQHKTGDFATCVTPWDCPVIFPTPPFDDSGMELPR